MSTNAFFTSPTVQANRLLRPFSQFNTGDGLVYQNLPLGENKGRSIQILVNRRYANGFTANMALSFTRTRSNRTINEFDRAPTLWLDDNNSRPYRLSGGAVYELPFGANRRWMSDGGVLRGARRRMAAGRHVRKTAWLPDSIHDQCERDRT